MNGALVNMKASDYAHLLLACNVGLITPTFVPGTKLKWAELVENSIVLPYYFTPDSPPQAYSIPPVFWIEYAVGVV
jgi:hypothetical protein